uniref:Uncharacterized protein n=1 Tax=Phragmatopoma lapidosa TaxID=341668 RepID=A0A0A0QZ22_9ANNE|nr:hypothetical protein [Phragmatopoma lapidosa]
MVGQQVRYPYSFLGKFVQFPWKHYWKNARGFRYSMIALAVTYPLFLKIHQIMNSPGNVREWTKIRERRLHDHFAPPSMDDH